MVADPANELLVFPDVFDILFGLAPMYNLHVLLKVIRGREMLLTLFACIQRGNMLSRGGNGDFL